MPEAQAATEDIDIAAFPSIAVALDDYLEPGLEEALKSLGPFLAKPGLHAQPTAWRDQKNATVVELLAANEHAEREEPIELPALGAYATPLRFLDYLIHEPIHAAVLYRSGILVNVPQPARYVVHKLIIAVRRAQTASQKSAKDVAQAAALRVLGNDRPDELEEAYKAAFDRGPSWQEALGRGMRRLPQDALAQIHAIGSSKSGKASA